jgi:translation initiation factor IF-2
VAKKTAALRVHTLAKELGVSSKDIVAKCQAEDIPDITNHMSAVSVGLSHTIREWFSVSEAGESSTAVEKAAPVDVEKARAKVKKATKKASAKPKSAAEDDDAGADDGGDSTATATLEPPAPEATPAAPAPAAPAAPTPAAPAPAAPTPAAPEPSADDAGSTDRPVVSAPAIAADAPTQAPTPAKMNVPDRPTQVAPVGPQLEQPKKVSLSGPKVIRIEEPEPERAPRRSGPPGGGMMSSTGPRRGGGAGGGMEMDSGFGRGGGGGRRGGGGPGGPGAKARSPRRNEGRTGRAAPGGDQPFQPWRAQDMLERDQALKHSQGFFRSHRQDRMRGGGGGKGGGGRRQVVQKPTGPVKVSEPITIKELSAASGVKAADILKKLFLAGTPATINSSIETEQAIEIMIEYDIELQVEEAKTAAEVIEERFAARDRTDERSRSPIVTILGHVDHGKTSLLDRIRRANVAAGEAGGITQATSAFQVPVHAGDRERLVTFIDTPGHEAFTAMRARGAKVTDVVVLVVAADDGVMPQTEESISHAKAAGVPIVVALNKIDKAEATDSNIQRILGQLAERELNPTEWGGGTEVIRTSATTGEGIQELLDILDYQADLLELKGDFAGNAEGTVIEAQVEEGRGPVARMLVQDGLLKKGAFIVTGRGFGRVRDIVNDHGQRIDEAGPSTPVAISGIDELPDAGDRFFVVDSLKEAEAAAEERRRLERERELAAPKITLDNIFAHIEEGKKKDLPLVVKADVQGSVETLRVVLGKIGSDEVRVSVKHSAVGGINESDVTLAEATGAIIIGFNVTTTAKARQLAEAKGVDIRLYDVIYDITDDVQKAAAGLLDPELKLEVLGHAEVRDVFRITRVGAVAGCYITDGVVERNAQIRVTRDGIVIEKDRRLDQLKRFKDDVKEVKNGMECGMKIDGYDDIKVGDVLECYKTIAVARTL